MLTIYGSDLSSPSNKVRMAANLLGLKYDYKKVNLREGEHKKAEFLKMHPAGKVPVIDDDGFVLFESGAIVKYLAEKAGSDIYPKDIKQRAQVDQWIDFINAHIGSAAMKIVYNRIFKPRRNIPVDEQEIKTGLEDLEKFLPIVNEQLAKNKYVAGNKITLADISLLVILDPSEVASIDISKYSNIMKWRAGLQAQEFYTKCHKSYADALNALK
ncbi:MAG: glutathione S-transferase family protein [Candidatus Omnitrophota bacterium]